MLGRRRKSGEVCTVAIVCLQSIQWLANLSQSELGHEANKYMNADAEHMLLCCGCSLAFTAQQLLLGRSFVVMITPCM